ncbi:MAG TPA: NAD(P)H-dependent oxidoreductase [Acidimicrobiia bacterium]|nr:NAD(P)H-dependent oxidoreductase [Acidimicrobiia bacterium]
MTIAVVVGNPKPASRTLEAAGRLAKGLAGAAPDTVVDLVDLGPKLLGWGDPDVAAAVEAVAGSSLAVFASPTYKATFTGLLKLFLEQFENRTGLAGVTAVPLMLGAGPRHALAPEVHLRPVLSELGASCPLPALYLIDSTYTTDGVLDEYVARWRPLLRTGH